MKNFIKTTSVALLLIALGSNAQESQLPRSFYKGCLVTSITGGPSRALFTTFDNKGDKVHSEMAVGMIDPLIMEYGLTNKYGVGFTKGGENYMINVNDFYSVKLPDMVQNMSMETKYFTFDFSYHPYVTKRLDVSLFSGIGFYKVRGQADIGYGAYTYDSTANMCVATTKESFNYNGKGAVIRAGARARYYFSKRFGLMAMGYCFNGIVKEKPKQNPVSDQINKSGYATMLTGAGLEFGICFRIIKQKGVKQEVATEKEFTEDKVPLVRVVWD